MKKNIKALWLALVSTLLILSCEHPSEFKRDISDKTLDIDGINITVKIIKPEQNEIISGLLTIRVEPIDTITQYMLDLLEIFIDDSLITTRTKVPFDLRLNTENLYDGNHTLAYKVYNWNDTYNEDSVQFIKIKNNQLEILILESNTIKLEWESVLNFNKYIVLQSEQDDMLNSVEVATINDPLPLSFTMELDIKDRLYFQIVAINNNGDSVKSNVKGVNKILMNTAHINNDENSLGVTVGSDGTVFLANGSDGLRAYAFNGSEFTNTAHIDNGGDAKSVALGPDNTVFLGNGDDGLRAYTFNGSTFSNTVHIDNGGNASDVEVNKDGTVFLANGPDGLRTYAFSGSEYTSAAHIDNGGYAKSVAVGPDDTIFLANGPDGLRAYVFKWIVL